MAYRDQQGDWRCDCGSRHFAREMTYQVDIELDADGDVVQESPIADQMLVDVSEVFCERCGVPFTEGP